MVSGILFFFSEQSIMVEQTLGAPLEVPSSPQAMIMMLHLMNMVSLEM